MTFVGTPRYILAALTGEAVADLICCSDSLEFEFFTSHLRSKAIGFEIITQSDAIKLLIAGKVLAFGCYLTTGNRATDETLSRVAKARYMGLSSEFGLVRLREPIALSAAMLPEEPRLVSANR